MHLKVRTWLQETSISPHAVLAKYRMQLNDPLLTEHVRNKQFYFDIYLFEKFPLRINIPIIAISFPTMCENR